MVLKRKLGLVDLSKERVTVEDVPNSLRKALFGGRGMNVYYLYKMLGDNVDPLSPENILIFGTGLMTPSRPARGGSTPHRSLLSRAIWPTRTAEATSPLS